MALWPPPLRIYVCIFSGTTQFTMTRINTKFYLPLDLDQRMHSTYISKEEWRILQHPVKNKTYCKTRFLPKRIGSQQVVLSSCTGSQELMQKTQQCSTAKQRFVKQGVQWLFPLCTSTPGHNPTGCLFQGHKSIGVRFMVLGAWPPENVWIEALTNTVSSIPPEQQVSHYKSSKHGNLVGRGREYQQKELRQSVRTLIRSVVVKKRRRAWCYIQMLNNVMSGMSIPYKIIKWYPSTGHDMVNICT